MEEQAAPTLCRMGCGFFGSSATEGMCSQCFRDYQRRKQEQSTSNSAASQQVSSNQTPNSAGASSIKKGVDERDYSEGERPLIVRYGRVCLSVRYGLAVYDMPRSTILRADSAYGLTVNPIPLED